MLKQSHKSLKDLIESIPQGAKVLDIGGAAAPFARANYIIDIQPYENVHWDKIKGENRGLVKKENYVQQDICSREPWPYPDKFFDYSYCSHTLEDIRDPIWVCSEIVRTSKAGYIEVPSRAYEQTIGLEVKNLAGASHHRWLTDIYDGKLRFTFKYVHIHSQVVNKSKPVEKDEDLVLKIEWSGDFEYYENWLKSGKDIFEYYLDRPIGEKEMWQIFRKTQNRNFVVKWIAYLKNVNPWLKKKYESGI